MTLEQLRAQFAWEKANEYNSTAFTNLAKGAPALIMTNGLMASLAFWKGRNEAARVNLVNSIIAWLNQRHVVESDNFNQAMQELLAADLTKYMKATNESLDFLKWLRHFAAALDSEGE